MVDVDNLTDAELRTKLLEFGFPVMPITGTTRKILMKKLKLLLENKGKTNADERRSLARFSSDDDSEPDTKFKKNKDKRVTAPPATLSSSGRPQRSSRFNDKGSDVRTTSNEPRILKNPDEKITKVNTFTSTKTVVKTMKDEFDNGSDSEPELMENMEEDVISDKNTRQSYGFLTRNISSLRTPSLSPSSPYVPKYTPSFSTSDDALERLNQIRSRLSLGTSAYSRPTTSYISTASPTIENNSDEPVESPFLSNFTKRLSQMSANSPKPTDYGFKSDIIKENDTNSPGSYARNYLTRYDRYKDSGSRYQRQDSNMVNVVRNNMVSFALVGVVILFFFFLGMMYLGLRSDSSAIDTAGYIIPYCVDNDKNSIRGENCLMDHEVMAALTLMRNLKPELERCALKNKCSDPSVNPYMSEDEVVTFIRESKGNLELIDIRKIINNLHLLVFKNPNWGISVVKTAGKIVTEADVLHTRKQVMLNRVIGLVGLAYLNPNLPWQCIIFNKFYGIINSLLVIGFGFFLIYAGNFSYKLYKQYKQDEKDEVFGVVEKVVDIIQNHAEGENEPNYLVVNHVRDMIIPITDRKRKDKIWAKAVKFINENESRIRTEVQVVQGEPYEVWRWLGSHNNISESTRNKAWQGQAFETEVGSMNSLPCSPTPCLKIRGILNTEAVLSKCAQQCKILHCSADNNSKCIYLKCASQNDAAIAYKNLHGWWYAGNLITVKYVRLERYMQRFPDSPASGPPFMK